MRIDEFDRYYGIYKNIITAIARKLARSDDELVKDLQQEGSIALWKLNPKKAKTNQDAWIRQAIKFRMIDYLRKYNPRSFESLDAALEHGDQLEQDPVTGEMMLLSKSRYKVVITDNLTIPAAQEALDTPSKDELLEDLIKREERIRE